MYGYFKKREESEISMFTDLAVERRRADLSSPGIKYEKKKSKCGFWETVEVTSEKGEEAIGRPRGIYATLNLERMDELDIDELDDAIDDIARKLCEICDRNRIIPARILVAGLGNENLTPDTLGPRTAERVSATMQIERCDRERFLELECSEIAVIAPGVCGKSGLDAYEWVSSISEIGRAHV